MQDMVFSPCYLYHLQQIFNKVSKSVSPIKSLVGIIKYKYEYHRGIKKPHNWIFCRDCVVYVVL